MRERSVSRFVGKVTLVSKSCAMITRRQDLGRMVDFGKLVGPLEFSCGSHDGHTSGHRQPLFGITNSGRRTERGT